MHDFVSCVFVYARLHMHTRINLQRVFLTSLIVSLVLAAVVGIGIFLFGRFGSREIQILLTILFLVLYSLTALCCAALYERRKYPLVWFPGFLASAAALLMTLASIWELPMARSADERVLSLGVLAFALAHASVLLLLTMIPRSIAWWVRALTLCFIALTAGVLIIIINYEGRVDDDFVIRILGCFAILDALGTLLTPIVLKMTSSKR